MTQQVLPFVRLDRRRDRAFKAAILATTALAIVAILAGSPTGRHATVVAANRVRRAVREIVGLKPPREEIEAERQRWRRIGVARTRSALARAAAEGGPRIARMLKVARMDPDSALIRWGNYNATLVLSSDVFEPDDAGRSYRLRPNTRSIWFIGLSLFGAPCRFEVRDAPDAREACAAAGGRLVPASVQTTNSWGCRGPEPDTGAPLRVIVLGDSVMQGVLVGDDETPPARLERRLAERTGLRTSVLNAGVLGYSPEQYFYTLLQLGERMRPHFVVVSLCGNDFGPWNDPEGWDEGAYWLGLISRYCQARDLPYLFVPWPGEDALLSIRDESLYPGQISRRLRMGGMHYFYPVEAFTNEDLRLRVDRMKRGTPDAISPLYNRHLLGDNHLSPPGCDLWGRVVAERVVLILERRESLSETGRAASQPAPRPEIARSSATP